MIFKTNWQNNDYYDLTFDLTRIEKNLEQISNNFKTLMYICDYKAKIWIDTDTVTKNNYNLLKQKFDKLVDDVKSDISKYPTSPIFFDYNLANKIEIGAKDLNDLQIKEYKNTIFCGNTKLSQNRINQRMRVCNVK